MAYLMRVEHLTLSEAYTHVRACRPIVCPNDGYVYSLPRLPLSSPFPLSTSSLSLPSQFLSNCTCSFMRQLMALEMQIFNTPSSSMTWEWKMQTQACTSTPFDNPPSTLPSPPLHQDSPSALSVSPPSPTNPFALLDTGVEQENFLVESTSTLPHATTPTPPPLSPELLHETCAAATQHAETQHATLGSFVQMHITSEILNGLRGVYGILCLLYLFILFFFFLFNLFIYFILFVYFFDV